LEIKTLNHRRGKTHRRNDMVHAHEKSDRNENLKRMLAPRSVAIIGESSKEDNAGYKAVKAFDRFEGDA
jgi:hypothetical protein